MQIVTLLDLLTAMQELENTKCQRAVLAERMHEERIPDALDQLARIDARINELLQASLVAKSQSVRVPRKR